MDKPSEGYDVYRVAMVDDNEKVLVAEAMTHYMALQLASSWVLYTPNAFSATISLVKADGTKQSLGGLVRVKK